MKDIIPYDYWINSQLSIARHYGGMKIDGKNYVVDYIFAKEKDGLCFPNLVEEKLYLQMQKERKEETKKYYNEVKRLQKERQSTINF